MKFKTEQNGQMFLVVNASTGEVRGRHKNKGEADFQTKRLQKDHDAEIERSSARHTPASPVEQSQTNDGTE